MFEATLPYKIDIHVHQGASFQRTLSWLTRDTEEPVIPLDDFRAKMVLEPIAAENGKAITLTTENGGISFVPSQGRIIINITAAQSAAMKFNGAHRKWGEYDLLIYPETGTDPNYYLIRGDVILTKRITKR